MKILSVNKVSIPPVLMLTTLLTLTGCGMVNSHQTSTVDPIPAPVESINPVAEKPTETPSPTPTVQPSPTQSATVPPTDSTTAPPSETTTPSPSPSETMTDEKAIEKKKEDIRVHEPLVRYTITKLNVRSGPGTEYEIIDYLNEGDKIRVDATTKDWQRLEGTKYWVSSGYLNKEKPVNLSQAEENKKRLALEKIAGKYGCPTATVIIDDPRLGSVANAKADWGANSILFRSTAPQSRWDYLMAHECSHLLQYNIYGGDIDKLSADMNKIYGGVNYEGLEQNSDCFVYAVNPKNTQWHYTQECDGKRGEAAQAIAQGRKPKTK